MASSSIIALGSLLHFTYEAADRAWWVGIFSAMNAPGGSAFVHTIGSTRARTHIEPWFGKYIFPNAVLPTLAQLIAAMDGVFVPEDVHNLGEDYDLTLMAWWHNFDAAWPTLRARYGEPFYRMWKYYLLASAGAFRARAQQLFQIVMTRPGTPQPLSLRG